MEKRRRMSGGRGWMAGRSEYGKGTRKTGQQKKGRDEGGGRGEEVQ